MQKTMENTPFCMGKSTISMAMFNGYLSWQTNMTMEKHLYFLEKTHDFYGHVQVRFANCEFTSGYDLLFTILTGITSMKNLHVQSATVLRPIWIPSAD